MARKQGLLTQSIAQLNSRKVVKAPAVKNLSKAELAAAAAQIINQGGIPALMPAMELSTRHPYDPAGRMDVYMPGRWDCKYDLLFMDALVTGPGSGEWNGTICYVTFVAPANGNYLIAANFSGYQITMRQGGPWGESTAYAATPSSHAAVTSLWTGSAGETLEYSLHCTGGGVIGYLKSVQIFLLS